MPILKKTSFAFLCFSSACLFSTSVFAQTAAKPPAPPLAPAPVAPVAPQSPAVIRAQSFVLMSMTGDASVDPYLKSTADELNRRLNARGYSTVDPARVGQAISENPAAIASIRTKLAAACMVRVDIKSRATNQISLGITVQNQSGDKTAAVEGSLGEISAKVIAAVEPLLTNAPAPVAAPVPVPVAPVVLSRVVLKDGTSVDCEVLGLTRGVSVSVRLANGTEQAIAWDQISQIYTQNTAVANSSWTFAQPAQASKAPSRSWDARGGPNLILGVQGEVLGMMASLDHRYTMRYPDSQVMRFTGDALSGGGGGGLGFHVGYLHMFIPQPSDHSTILALHAGTGFDLGVVAFGYREDSYTTIGLSSPNGGISKAESKTGGATKWNSATVFMLPLNFGAQIGLGKFSDSSTWRGVMLGVDWRPTYTYSKPSDLDGISYFNYAGIQANIDVTTLTADSSLESHFRISAFYLPQIDRNPSYAGLGFGSAWY